MNCLPCGDPVEIFVICIWFSFMAKLCTADFNILCLVNFCIINFWWVIHCISNEALGLDSSYVYGNWLLRDNF